MTELKVEKKSGFLTDHQGKPSTARAIGVLSMGIAGALALAPLWGGPAPNFEIVVLFVLGGPGLKVWQSVSGKD